MTGGLFEIVPTAHLTSSLFTVTYTFGSAIKGGKIMAYGSMLDMLFNPMTAVLFGLLFIVCLVLLVKGKTNRTPLIIILALCGVYLLFVIYLSVGFGSDIPTAAPPAPPK